MNVDTEFNSSNFLGKTIYYLASTDKQGLDGFSTNNQCNMFVLTTEDKLRSVFY